MPSYTSPRPITAGPMQGGRRGIYGEWIPEGGAQGGLTMGSSYAIQAGGGSQPDTGMNSYNRDTFGAISGNSVLGEQQRDLPNWIRYLEENPAAMYEGQSGSVALSGLRSRLAGIQQGVTGNPVTAPPPVMGGAAPVVPAAMKTQALSPAYTQPSIIPAANPPSASGVGGFGASRQQELPYWMKRGGFR